MSIEDDILEYKRKRARASSRAWYQKNKERKRESNAAYRKANPDKFSVYNRRSYLKKKEKLERDKI